MRFRAACPNNTRVLNETGLEETEQGRITVHKHTRTISAGLHYHLHPPTPALLSGAAVDVRTRSGRARPS